jgi:tRNA(fMet)-specific endonuclease VapC
MSGRYMLDTGTCAFLLRRTSDTLLQRIPSAPVVQQVISVVTCAGLLYGVEPSSKKKANQAAVDALARQLAVLQWPPDAARHCAEIRADLEKKGAMFGANDPMIARTCAQPGRRRRHQQHRGLRADQGARGRKLAELIASPTWTGKAVVRHGASSSTTRGKRLVHRLECLRMGLQHRLRPAVWRRRSIAGAGNKGRAAPHQRIDAVPDQLSHRPSPTSWRPRSRRTIRPTSPTRWASSPAPRA